MIPAKAFEKGAGTATFPAADRAAFQLKQFFPQRLLSRIKSQ
jgi:hypothetical protein